MSGEKDTSTIEKLEWSHLEDSDTWRCLNHPEYIIIRWWETLEIKDPRDFNDTHYYEVNEDERFDTLEEAMAFAQSLFERESSIDLDGVEDNGTQPTL